MDNIFTEYELQKIEEAKKIYPEYIPEKKPHRFVDLTGQIFGRVTILYRTYSKIYSNGQHVTMWVGRCSCGNIITASAGNLKQGHVISCGCYNNERISQRKKYNKFDLASHSYGVGWTTNTNQKFYFDLEDYNIIKEYCWRENDQGYITTSINHHTSIRLHRLIMQITGNEIIDHINNQRYDNRKQNLRIANKSTNGMNRGCNKNNKLGIKGVFFFDNKYNAHIMKDGKQIYIGAYDTLEEAEQARIQKEKELFGEFAFIK